MARLRQLCLREDYIPWALDFYLRRHIRGRYSAAGEKDYFAAAQRAPRMRHDGEVRPLQPAPYYCLNAGDIRHRVDGHFAIVPTYIDDYFTRAECLPLPLTAGDYFHDFEPRALTLSQRPRRRRNDYRRPRTHAGAGMGARATLRASPAAPCFYFSHFNFRITTARRHCYRSIAVINTCRHYFRVTGHKHSHFLKSRCA